MDDRQGQTDEGGGQCLAGETQRQMEGVSLQQEGNVRHMRGYSLHETTAQQSHEGEAWDGSARLWLDAGSTTLKLDLNHIVYVMYKKR